MATRSSILVWEIPWTERRLAGYSGFARLGHDLATDQQQSKDKQRFDPSVWD